MQVTQDNSEDYRNSWEGSLGKDTGSATIHISYADECILMDCTKVPGIGG